jgi:hypothetical protein
MIALSNLPPYAAFALAQAAPTGSPLEIGSIGSSPKSGGSYPALVPLVTARRIPEARLPGMASEAVARDPRRLAMTLLTAHKILILSAVAFFAFYGSWELRSFTATGAPGAALRALLAFVVAVGFGLYLRGVWGKSGRPRPRGG